MQLQGRLSPAGDQTSNPNVMQRLQSHIKRNQAIPENAKCSFPNCDVKIPAKPEMTAYVKQRPVSQKTEQIISDKVEEWYKQGIIIDSIPGCPYNSRILAAKRVVADGSIKWRVCIDFRKLNRISLPNDKFQLPRVDQIMYAMQGSSHFATMDISQCFPRYPIAEEDRPKIICQIITKKSLLKYVPS